MRWISRRLLVFALVPLSIGLQAANAFVEEVLWNATLDRKR